MEAMILHKSMLGINVPMPLPMLIFTFLLFRRVLYAGTDGGVYRSADDGVNFEDLSNTLSSLKSTPCRLRVLILQNLLVVCKIVAAIIGINWNSYHGGDGMGTAVDPFEENTYYGMTQYEFNPHHYWWRRRMVKQ